MNSLFNTNDYTDNSIPMNSLFNTNDYANNSNISDSMDIMNNQSNTYNSNTSMQHSGLNSGIGGLLGGIGSAAKNGIRTELGIQGVNGNVGNKDNINDFMKDATLLGNNIYISPMNNDKLYNPQNKLASLGKISSSFFPMIKIAQ